MTGCCDAWADRFDPLHQRIRALTTAATLDDLADQRNALDRAYIDGDLAAEHRQVLLQLHARRHTALMEEITVTRLDLLTRDDPRSLRCGGRQAPAAAKQGGAQPAECSDAGPNPIALSS